MEGSRTLLEGFRTLHEGDSTLREGFQTLPESFRTLRKDDSTLPQGFQTLRECLGSLPEYRIRLIEGSPGIQLSYLALIFRYFWNNKIMDATQTVLALRALSHDVRLASYRALVQAGPAGMPVGSLRDLLGLPAATLTAHLNQLRQAGLVIDQREGRVIRLRADYERMNALIGFLTENCCGGQSCAPVECVQPPDADATGAQ